MSDKRLIEYVRSKRDGYRKEDYDDSEGGGNVLGHCINELNEVIEYSENLPEKPFTANMGRQATAMGLLTSGCSVDILEEVCNVLRIDTTDIKGNRAKLRLAVIENYSEGWE